MPWRGGSRRGLGNGARADSGRTSRQAAARRFRTWAFESAELDLALRQASKRMAEGKAEAID